MNSTAIADRPHNGENPYDSYDYVESNEIPDRPKYESVDVYQPAYAEVENKPSQHCK